MTGKVSAAALKFAFKEYKLRLGISMDNNSNNDVECHGMITSNLGVPFRHKFRLEAAGAAEAAAAIPPRPPRFLFLEDFDSHWWLVQPPRQGRKTEDPISFVDKISLIRDEFIEGTSYRQRVILDHLDVLPAAEVFNPFIQYGRGRPVGGLGHQTFGHQLVRSTQRHPSQFEHVKNSFRPVRRGGNCGLEGHNRRRYQQPLLTPEGTALLLSNDLGAEDDWKHFRYPSNVYE